MVTERVEMPTADKQEIEAVRQVSQKVQELLGRLEVPPREPSGGATWEACQRDLIANDQNLSPLRATYRQRVLAVLEDDWVAIERTLENRKPQTLVRLNELRNEILQRTDPAKKYECRLEPREGKFGPDVNLEKKIKRLAEELEHVANQLEKDDLEALQSDAPDTVKPIFWVRKHARNHPIIVVACVVASIPCFLLSHEILTREHIDESRQPTRSLSADPNTGRTPLRARTKARVDQRVEYLIREKIDPWLLMEHTKRTIALHDGRPYGHYGIKHSGTVVDFFWGKWIEPFLKDNIKEVLDEVGAECRANNIDASAPLQEAAALLKGMAYRVYSRMLSVDRRLRGAKPIGVPSDPVVQWKIEQMKKVIDEQLVAAKALYSGRSTPPQ